MFVLKIRFFQLSTMQKKAKPNNTTNITIAIVIKNLLYLLNT